MASSSRSNLGGRSTLGRCASELLRWSAVVRGWSPVCVGVVTQLDTHHPALLRVIARETAVRERSTLLYDRPACVGRQL